VKSVLMAAMVVGLLSACTSGDPKPNLSTVTTSSAPSSTTSASPSVATTGPNVLPGARPPVMPDFAKQRTADGAVVFVSFVIRALDWGYSTTDSRAVRPYFAAGCGSCDAQVAAFDDIKNAGHHFRGGHLSVITVGTAPLGSRFARAEEAVDVTIDIGSLVELDASGRQVGPALPAKRHTFRVYVGWLDQSWKVVASVNVVAK
jgi:uncharacterized protein DUF6318